jgi:hypothetical protein
MLLEAVNSVNATDITTLISTVGFPIFSWLVMAWYLYKRGIAEDAKNKELSDKLEELNKSCLTTIAENTKVLQELCSTIKERG